MNPVWQDILQRSGARLAGDEVLDFGDRAGELGAACSAASLVPLTHLGVVRASGEDAQMFLHNLLTNDVKRLGPTAAQWNGLCSAKGRLLANFLIWRDEASYLLQLAAELQPAELRRSRFRR